MEQTSVHILREGHTDGADHLLSERIVETCATLDSDWLLLELVLIVTITVPDDASRHHTLGQITNLALDRSTYHLAARGATLAVENHHGTLELYAREHFDAETLQLVFAEIRRTHHDVRLQLLGDLLYSINSNKIHSLKSFVFVLL